MANQEVPMRPDAGSMERPLWEFAFGDHTRDWHNNKKTLSYRAVDNALYSYEMKIARWVDDVTVEVLMGAKVFSRTTGNHVRDADHWLSSRLTRHGVQVVKRDGIRALASAATEIGWHQAQARNWWVYFPDELPAGARLLDPDAKPEVEVNHLVELVLHALALHSREFRSYKSGHVLTFGSLRAERGKLQIGGLDLIRCDVVRRARSVFLAAMHVQNVQVLNLVGRQSWQWSYGQKIEPIIVDRHGIEKASFSEAQQAVQQIMTILSVNHIPYTLAAGVEHEGQPAWEADHPTTGFLPIINDLWRTVSYGEEDLFEDIDDTWNWVDVAAYGDYIGNLAIKAILCWMDENADGHGWFEGSDYLWQHHAYNTQSLWLRVINVGVEKEKWTEGAVTPIFQFWVKHFGAFMRDNEQRYQAHHFDAFATLVHRRDFDYGGGQYFQTTKLPDFIKDVWNAVILEEIESDLDNWVDWDFGLRDILPGDRGVRTELYEAMARELLTKVEFVDQGAHLSYDIDILADALLVKLDVLDLDMLDPEDKRQKPLYDALVQRGVQINQQPQEAQDN